jgi:predicted SnoaL-like aldol condensation-catalyzing enzyme
MTKVMLRFKKRRHCVQSTSGEHGTITGIDIYRITDGKIEEAWSNWGTLRLLQQIGAIPPMS